MRKYKLGLIGYPLAHSLSPVLHRAALQTSGLEGDYSLFTLSPEEAYHGGIQSLLSAVRNEEIHGLNVTIPYKQQSIPHLDRLTETAAAIGAVNTVYLDDGALVGENTDAPGVYRDLETTFRRSLGTEIKPGICLLLGAGGAARAVAHSLVKEGWQVRVTARRFAQAESLAADLGFGVVSVAWPPQAAALENVRLIINATPIGMYPDVHQSPWIEGVPFPPNVLVYDLVYNPPVTQLVRQARQAGLPAETGLGMLVHQAALAFSLWTGAKPSIQAMFQAAREAYRVKGE